MGNKTNIYKKSRFLIFFSSFFLVDSVTAAPFLESAKVAPENIQSCIADSGINPLSNQVELSRVDISGPLPFIRSYSTTIFFGGTHIQYYNTLMDREIREMGIGWTHNYDYKMDEGVGIDFNGMRGVRSVFLPEIGRQIYFQMNKDGSFTRTTGAPRWNLVKDKETTLTELSNNRYIVNHKGTEIEFEFRPSQKGFIATKATYPGGKVLNFSYVFSTAYNRWLLTKVADNTGNTLSFNRINLDGKSTDPNAQHYRGAIFSVSSNNKIQPQTVQYSYNVGEVTWPEFFFLETGPEKAYRYNQYPNLTQVTSTANPQEDYSYTTYSKPAAIRSSVSFPIISEFKQANILRRTWAYTDNSITSKVPDFPNEEVRIQTENINNQHILSIFRRFNNTLTQTDRYIHEIDLGNSDVGSVPSSVYQGDERYARYQSDGYASCLTYNNVPLKDIVTSNSIRQLSSITDQNSNRTDFSYDENNRLLETVEAKGTTSERKTSLSYTTKFWIPSTIKRGNLTQTNTVNTLGQITESLQSSTQTGSIKKTTIYEYLANGLLSFIDGPRTGTADKVSFTYDSFGNKASASQTVNGSERTTSYVGYNSYGQPERIVYPSGLVDKFNYNSDGSLKNKITGTGGSATVITGKTTEYTYDSLKRVASESSPDGEITSYSYNLKDQPTTIIAPDGSKIIKEYYGNGVVSVEKKTDSTDSTIFDQTLTEIDVNGRPSVIKRGSPAWSSTKITYDGNGNRTQSTSALDIAEKWTYNAFNKVLSHSNGLSNLDTKTYDAQDNTLTALDSLKSGTNPYSYRNGGILTQEVNADYGTKNIVMMKQIC
ncbi:RHS repeat protein [Acinetobacter sp. 1124_18A]|uniref:RHS repeat domain-containing protein n=1 Tax=Acinetobacter sp. 1124_18A TaxID=2605958 RepID=UPI00405976FF